MTRVTTKGKPSAAKPSLKVREISADEHRAKTRTDQEEFRKLLLLAHEGKTLEIGCDEYREARLMAQRLTACRSFYGFDVTIQHRGKQIYLTPRKASVAIEMVPVGDEVTP